VFCGFLICLGFFFLAYSKQLCLTGCKGDKSSAEQPGHPWAILGIVPVGWEVVPEVPAVGHSTSVSKSTFWKGSIAATSAKHFFPCCFSFLLTPSSFLSSQLLQSMNSIWQILTIFANGLGMMEPGFLQMCWLKNKIHSASHYL